MAKESYCSTLHVLALLKGTIEGDPYAHFASLLGLRGHHGAAQRLGLMDMSGATQAGREFYDAARLAEFPAGRANDWGFNASKLLAAAECLLKNLHNKEEG